jgi:putative transport protein
VQALTQTFRNNPELAIFLTLALGFWLGNLKFGSFSLGVVTCTLLAACWSDRCASRFRPNVKSVFFLMFLFAVGYASAHSSSAD